MSDTSSQEIRVKIEGMSCAHCSSAVTQALENVEGVQSVSVNIGTDSANIVYDTRNSKGSKLLAAVEEAGYRLISRQLRIQVGGMSCAHCVEAVTKSLLKIPQIIDAQVNLGTDSAQVEYIGWEPPETQIKNAVEQAGYKYEGQPTSAKSPSASADQTANYPEKKNG